ncbi:MAG: toll/interleukin-1 receptor domain-containing protein [Desulfobaccales bacterium]
MKVFISWSGERSRKLAEYLAGWLKKLPLAIEPWVSKDAIDPGTRWGKELAEALQGTSFGILCITSENQREPWISFEAGALSKTIEKSYVIPYIIGMAPSELEQPLKQFQAIEANEEDTWKLIETIHRASGDKTRTINDLEEAFRMWWPKLTEQIELIKSEPVAAGGVSQEPSMTDIKASLDKVSTVLESLSSRILRWESEHFLHGNEGLGLRGYSILRRSIRDELSRRDNITWADLDREQILEELANDPAALNMITKIFTRVKKLKQVNSVENDQSKK